MFFGAFSALSLAATAITGSLFVWAASRFFVEARRTGELEVLLTTPVGAKLIVSAQWDRLKRLALGPVLLILAPLLFQAAIMFSAGYAPSPKAWRIYYGQYILLNSAGTVLSFGALCWLGLWFGLRMGVQGRVILWSVLLVDGLPYVLTLVWPLFYRTFAIWGAGSGNSWFSPPWLFGTLTPQLARLLLYVWLIRLARSQLSHELTGVALCAPSEILSNALPWVASLIRRWSHP